MATILLAEDDESLRKFLAQALIRAGHDVTDFGDGSEAWECLKGVVAFDLLLTDIVMPGMDGIELAKRAAEMTMTCRTATKPMPAMRSGVISLRPALTA